MATLLRKLEKGRIPTIKAGFYGGPGQGKTSLMAGFNEDPRTGPALWLDCGGNPDMLIQNDRLTFAMSLDVADDILEPLNYLMTGQAPTHPFAKKWGEFLPKDPFKSLIIDTFSDWQGLLIDRVTGIKSDELHRYDLNSIQTPDPTKHGKEIAGKTLFAARQMLIALDLHVFAAFQEFEHVVFEGDDSGRITRGGKRNQISLWGQSRSRVPAWLKLMGRMYWEKGFKKEQVEVRPGVLKDRQVPDLYPVITWIDDEAHVKNQIAPSLGERLERPTAQLILDLIEQDYNK